MINNATKDFVIDLLGISYFTSKSEDDKANFSIVFTKATN